jgi:hypothetical protein
MGDPKSKAREDADRLYGFLHRPIFIAIATIIVFGFAGLAEGIREESMTALALFGLLTAVSLLIGLPTDAEHQRTRNAYQKYREIYHGDYTRESKERAELIAYLTIAEFDVFKHRRIRFWLPLIIASFAFVFAGGIMFLGVEFLDNYFLDLGRSDRKVLLLVAGGGTGLLFGFHYWRKYRREIKEELVQKEAYAARLREQSINAETTA